MPLRPPNPAAGGRGWNPVRDDKTRLATITGYTAKGSNKIYVDNAGSVKQGMWVRVVLQDSGEWGGVAGHGPGPISRAEEEWWQCVDGMFPPLSECHVHMHICACACACARTRARAHTHTHTHTHASRTRARVSSRRL